MAYDVCAPGDTVCQETVAALQATSGLPSGSLVTVPYTSNFVTTPFGNSSETVLTLSSFASQWAAGVATFPSSLSGEDPLATITAILKDRCTAVPTPDCTDLNAIAANAASIVNAALQASPAIKIVAAAAATPPAPPSSVYVPSTPAPPSGTTAGVAAAPPVPVAAPPISTPPALGARLTPQFILPVGLTNPVSFGITIVTTIIGALFGGIFGGADLSKLANAVNSLRSALAQTAEELYRFSWTIVYALGKLLSAFKSIWDTFIDGLWTLIKNLALALWHVLGEILPKLIQVLRQLRQWLDTIYRLYIRPILNYLQLIRRYLAILRALHVPFAGKLDQILTRIEGRIIGPFLYVLRTLNGLGGWLNVVLTATNVIQKPLFLRTMYAYQADWINMWWVAQTGPAPTGQPSPTGAAIAAPTQAQVQANFTEYTTANAGPYAAAATRGRRVLQGILANK